MLCVLPTRLRGEELEQHEAEVLLALRVEAVDESVGAQQLRVCRPLGEDGRLGVRESGYEEIAPIARAGSY